MTGECNTVDASPTKEFFVEMLTRDIHLEGAILDLLDNCVDGMLRSSKRDGGRLYDGFKADIKFDAKSFSISDNCGGIPWEMHEYAFRMGRPTQTTASNGSRSVGVYGIGMKRAIFKIGKRCTISTRSATEMYEIKITPEWIDKENEDDAWRIPVTGPFEPEEKPGTTITVSDLNEDIADMFDKSKNQKSFSSRLNNEISTRHAHMMSNGFTVTINGKTVEPTTVRIAFGKEQKHQDATVMPFIFKGKIDDVEVYLAVGLTGRTPRGRTSKSQAPIPGPVSEPGWTVVCNDRIVLYCDRTELAGWGVSEDEYDVPQYHTQYASIAGIVEFSSRDPSKLPTMTTKTGVDASSPIYRQVRRKMIEGTRTFVDYTNKWKGKEDKTAEHVQGCKLLSLDELKSIDLPLEVAHALSECWQYKPTLPEPTDINERQIAFKQETRKIKIVSEYLFDNPETSASKVGAKCFELIYDEAKQ